MATITADIAAVDRATFSLTQLAYALENIDSDGAIWKGLRDVVAELADDSRTAVQAAVPYGDTGELSRSVKLTPFPRGALSFRLKAGVKRRGINYGWFTELGTDAEANHAVDAIGYQHQGNRKAPANWKGIKAQHWFSGPIGLVLQDAPKKVSEAVVNALKSIFHR